MDTAFIVVATLALTLIVTTFLSWRERNETRDIAFLGALSGISTVGAGLLWLN